MKSYSRAVLGFKDDPDELKSRIIDCLETSESRLKLLSKESNVETIELKRGSNSVYVQYDDDSEVSKQSIILDLSSSGSSLKIKSIAATL